MKISEKQVQKACLHYLNCHDKVAYCYRNNSGAMYIDKRRIQMSPAGVSDIIGFLQDGRFLAVEIKAPEFYKDGSKKDHLKKLSEAQLDFLKLVTACGGVALCVCDVEELEKDLNNITINK